MANSDQASLTAVGEMMGISRRDILKARPYLKEFPAGKLKKNGTTHYDVQVVMNWAEGKDVKALVKAALAEDRRGQKPVSPLGQMARRMAAGEFATSEQRQSYAIKKLLARNFRRTPVNRITVRPDWMD